MGLAVPAEATAEVKSSETKDGSWMGSAVMIYVVWTMVSMMWIAFNAVRQIFKPKPKRRQEASETEDEEESQCGEKKEKQRRKKTAEGSSQRARQEESRSSKTEDDRSQRALTQQNLRRREGARTKTRSREC